MEVRYPDGRTAQADLHAGTPMSVSVERITMNHQEHARYMRRCLALAEAARATGDTPVGSLVVSGELVVAEGREAVRAREDVTAHAEIEALRAAFTRRGSRDLTGCTLYTSVEPCVMCAYAIRLARISVVVSGARSGDANAPVSGFMVLTDRRILPNHPPPTVVRDVLVEECQAVLYRLA
jgi:tRNA(adenine34) deaminase